MKLADTDAMTEHVQTLTSPLEPGSTIGILGGGQLGRMLAMAAARLGLNTHIYCARRGSSPAFDVAGRHTTAEFSDVEALASFASQVDCVTFEFENVPAATLDALVGRVPVAPPRLALEVAQDRLAEKTFLTQLGIPVAAFAEIDGAGSLERAVRHINARALLKTRRLGYDGKGQVRISPGDDAETALNALGGPGVPAILEKLEPFESEISVIAVRAHDGTTAFYDICENRHEGGILRETHIPADIGPAHQDLARNFAGQIADALGHVGVFAVELFYMGRDAPEPLKVNEIAPRVHNSGHWTLDACAVCQFENHIRAIAAWPLGGTSRHSDCVMTNIIGQDIENWKKFAGEPDTALHLYGKRDVLAGRKMGHSTRLIRR